MATFKSIHERNIFFSTLANISSQQTAIMPDDDFFLSVRLLLSYFVIFDGQHTQEGSVLSTPNLMGIC